MRSLIADRLKEAGFKVQTIAKTDLPGPEEIKIAGLTYWDGRIFICKKQLFNSALYFNQLLIIAWTNLMTGNSLHCQLKSK